MNTNTNPKKEPPSIEALIDKTAFAKKLLLTLCTFMIAGIAVIFLAVIISSFSRGIFTTLLLFCGYAVYAAPILLTFVFKLGIFADIGPIFYEVDIPIGNITESSVTDSKRLKASETIPPIILLTRLCMWMLPVSVNTCIRYFR